MERENNNELDVSTFGIESNELSNASAVFQPSLDEYYDTTHKRRGLALVFCHMNFSEMDKRDGTNKDRDDICNVLAWLDFEVRVFNDLSKKEVLETLKNVSAEDHTDSDCLWVVVMSHGDQGVLYARDAKYNVDSLWEHFMEDACPSLIGKPKMFFIQACRGEKLDEGVTTNAAAPRDMVDSETEPAVYFMPTMADLLVMYSTYDGYLSWRNRKEGSWFIQSLCKELKENARHKELLLLLTGVTRRTAFEYQSCVPKNEKKDAKKQIPCIVSTLTKVFYFTKKTE